MKFCTECGTGHECGDQASADVRIRLAEIERDKAIKLAEIGARETKTWAEADVEIAAVDAESGRERAEGEAEGMETVLDAGAPPPAAPPAVIQVPSGDGDGEIEEPGEPEDVPEVTPPPAEPESAGGFWGPAYR